MNTIAKPLRTIKSFYNFTLSMNFLNISLFTQFNRYSSIQFFVDYAERRGKVIHFNIRKTKCFGLYSRNFTVIYENPKSMKYMLGNVSNYAQKQMLINYLVDYVTNGGEIC